MKTVAYRRLAFSIVLVSILGACAGPVANRAFEEVASTSEQRIGQRPAWIKSPEDEQAVRETLNRLLSKPLSPDEAVQVALLNNRRLQAGFSELGIGAADLTSSWRPENPGFSFGRFRRGQDIEIERAVSIDPLRLLLLPISAGIESRRFEATKLRTASEVMSLAAQTKRAWYEAVAAEQTAKYVQQVRDSAEAQAELAKRMRQVGNYSVLDYARQQLFYASATAQLAKSRVVATVARERLARLMGVWGRDTSFRLPERLPDLPQSPKTMANVEATAIADRLDVQLAKAELESTRKAYGLTNATRFVNVLELGFQRNSESGEKDQTGYEISFEVPIFDFGDAKATRAESIYMRSVNNLADVAVNARSAARETYLLYQAAYDLARHYRDDVIPVRQKVAEESVLRYNGMLISVFELLSDAQDQIADVTFALEAQRDFWIADTNLTFVTIAPVDGAIGSPGGGRVAITSGPSAGH